MAKHTERSSTDSFGTKRELKVDGVSFQIFDLTKISSLTNGKLERLPYSIRVLLESLLRNEDGRHVRKDDVQSIIDYNPAKPDSVEIPFKPARVILQDFTGVPAVVDLAAMRSAMTRLGGDPAKINPLIPVDLVIDHSVQVDAYKSKDALAKNTEIEFDRNKERYEFLRWGQQAFSNFRVVPPSSGIVHQVNLEYLASVVQKKEIGDEIILLPDSLVGTDSHTTMINGLGVVGWGVGGIEAEAVMLGQPVYMLSPEVVGVELTGQLKEGATATDLTLTITQKLREHGVVGKFVEFYGPGLDHLTLPDRATIANMAPEYGATMGFFPIDEASLSYMRATGRSAEQVAITESYCRAQGLFRTNESPSPSYASVVKVELGQIVPSLAGPRRPQDRIPLSDMKSTWSSLMGKAYDDGGFGIDGDRRGDVSSVADRKTSLSHGSLVIAAITSCTNTSNPSVMIGAGLVAKKALEYGLRVPDYVKCSLAPGSRVVTAYLERAGLQSSFEDLGFFTVGYGCTTCIGNSGPLDEAVVTAIQEKDLVVTSVLSGNRNFEGRVSPHTKGNFLASPPLVVAYALAGKVDIDFETEAIGTSASGDAVYFRDLWPTAAEVNALIETSFDATLFRKSYDGVESSNSDWNDIKVSSGDIYAWSTDSTYIQEPPFFTTMTKETPTIQTIRNAVVLAKLGDSVTTDHISPAGAIGSDTPAAAFLGKNGVDRKDFNSYGSRRGNDRVMTRGTFANIRLRNQLAPGTEGGFTKDLTTGDITSIYEASKRYANEGLSSIVFAGKDYGMGSSRDWAAKGTLLLGVKAVVATSFERIHRSNLVGMGVLPLEFTLGKDADSYEIDGTERFSVSLSDDLKPLQGLTLQMIRADKSQVDIPVKLRIDTPVEIDYYRNGGILHTVLRDMLTNS